MQMQQQDGQPAACGADRKPGVSLGQESTATTRDQETIHGSRLRLGRFAADSRKLGAAYEGCDEGDGIANDGVALGALKAVRPVAGSLQEDRIGYRG